MTPDVLQRALAAELTTTCREWIADTCNAVRDDPAIVMGRFAAAPRRCRRNPVADEMFPGWTVGDLARCQLLLALPQSDREGSARQLYRRGDAAERRAVLLALPLLDIGNGLLDVVEDALRANDTRLVSAAMGSYGARWLSPAAWRHGALKCLFIGVPLDDIELSADRLDDGLARMCVDYGAERIAAGRPVPMDVRRVLYAFPRQLTRLNALEVRCASSIHTSI